MGDARPTAIPAGWEAADQTLVDDALGTVREALTEPDALTHLVTYYSRSGNYAGATFLELGPTSPWDITPADLLALTLLSVQAPPRAVRSLLEPSNEREQVLLLLSKDSLAAEADLSMAGADTLIAMAKLHEAVKSSLSPAHVRKSNRWVTASKLCARKRPDLFPIRDAAVCGVLGLGTNYQVDWQVFRHIIQDDGIRHRLDDLVNEAATRGAHVGDTDRRLRHLDALLWMGAVT